MLKEPIGTALNRRDFLGVIGVGATLPASCANSQSRLYLVSASPQSYGSDSFPSVLFSLGAQSTKVSWAATLISNEIVYGFVLNSFEDSVTVIAGATAEIFKFVILPGSSPGNPQTVEIPLNGRIPSSRHLVKRGNHLKLAFTLALANKHEVMEMDLRTFQVSRADPAELYKEFAIDGFVGGMISSNNLAFVRRTNDEGGLEYRDAVARVPLPVSLPPGSEQLIDKVLSTGLYISNSELLVFSLGAKRDARETTKSHFLVVERAKGEWHRIEVPLKISLPRAFGPWLACHIRERREPFQPSPGADARSTESRRTGATYDFVAEIFDLYQPGLIWLYHVPTRRTITEETGQGDTEVLWVADERVLYRCDRTLYEARIDGTRLVDRRKLIERDFIADVHWVFYGPPSDPPPNPPWEPFPVDE